MYSLDRIEGNIAVLINDDGESINVNLTDLPIGVKEGDMLEILNNTYVILKAVTNDRRKLIQDKLSRILSKNSD